MTRSILTSKDVMQILNICENTLLKLEREGRIKPDFRISNRKRYYSDNLEKSVRRMEKRF